MVSHGDAGGKGDTMVDIKTLPDTDALGAAAAQIMGDALAAACAATQDRVSWVVPGGRTPRSILPLVLARTDIDWARVDTLASDERLVPVDDPASTEGMLRGLFADAGVPCYYMSFGSDLDPDMAVATWNSEIDRMAWPPAVAFLGVGDDSHTASIFPGRIEARDPKIFTAAVPETAPNVAPRLTLGLGAIAQCEVILMLANNATKVAQLELSMAADADPNVLPVAAVLRMPQAVVLRV